MMMLRGCCSGAIEGGLAEGTPLHGAGGSRRGVEKPVGMNASLHSVLLSFEYLPA